MHKSRLVGPFALLAAGVIAQSLLASTASAVAAARPGTTAGRAPLALSGPRIFGWAFDQPNEVSSDGTHVWIASSTDNTVYELDASTGARVKVLNFTSKYGFNDPDGVSSDGTHVWVANGAGTVTELDASTGALVQVLSGSSYDFYSPDAVSSDGTHVWVADGDGTTVSEAVK